LTSGGGRVGLGWLLDPEECLKCYYNGRGKLGIPKHTLDRILEKNQGSRTKVFVESYLQAINGTRDPLKHVKAELNKKALQKLDEIHGHLEQQPLDKILSTISLANSVDTWMPNRELTGLTLKGASIVEGDALRKLESASTIAYLLDNSGEAVVDLAAALELADRGYNIAIIARGAPYELDVTVEETWDLLREVSRTLGYTTRRIKILGTGNSYPAPHPLAAGIDARNHMEQSEAVISKGIANFEAFLENCPGDLGKYIVALRAKCKPISSFFRVPLDTGVVAVLRCRRNV